MRSNMFQLTLPGEESKEVKLVDDPTEQNIHTAISDLAPISGSDGDVALTAGLESLEMDMTYTATNKRFSWGAEPTMGPGDGKEQPPPPPEFLVIKGTNGVLYVYVNCIQNQIGAFYQFLTALPESAVVNLMFYSINPCHVTAIQTAIILSKAKIHTKCFMIENEHFEAGMFFTWMLGNVLEPIPYGVVSLVEPLTLFSGSSKVDLQSRNDAINFDQTLKSKWYAYAEAIGLLTITEIAELNSGKAVLITDINDRVIRANEKKLTLTNPFLI